MNRAPHHGAVPAADASSPATTWLHPAVPIGGIVKLQTANGATLELLDYGQTPRK